MLVFPHCKINLGLWVTGQLDDGFHTIQTVMFPVPWCDILEIVPTTGMTMLTVTGVEIEGPFDKNLCFRAWKLLAEEHGIPSVAMHLHKIIPVGAGLGGGSSDAAFTLRVLNKLFDLKLTDALMQQYALQLGMDCTFFLKDIPALATGKGEILSPVNLNLDNYFLTIVKPPIHVSTADAYAAIQPHYREGTIDHLTSLPVAHWKDSLRNDFETSILVKFPEISEIKKILYDQGAAYASMSGSGSAVFGLFSQKPAEKEFRGCQVFQTLLGRNT